MSTSASENVGCRWCGAIHQGVCPLVKSFEYAEDGVTVKRVEFHGPKIQWTWGTPVHSDPPSLFESIFGKNR